MNKLYELVAPCHFGLEAVLKREIYDLGYEILSVEDGRVTFEGDAEAICRANVYLRTTERVLLQVAKFKATTFEELFQGIKGIAWEQYIPKNGKFWVTKATSVKSKLFSPTDIQAIVKKAMVEELKGVYHVEWFSEEGDAYPVRINLMKDEVSVCLDTTGDSLHKRGYRLKTSKAPITETLAAALIMLTPWRKDRILVDPFCGSGTFLIEAAMMAANIAPGCHREFLSMKWENLIAPTLWDEVMEEALSEIDTNIETDLQGYDIDPEVVKVARENAKRAGVDHLIHFQTREVAKLSHPKKYGFVITNPPYGERISEKEELPKLYGEIGQALKGLDSWSAYLITAYEQAAKHMGMKPTKTRKIYNGMLKTDFLQFIGPKPPRKNG
ncbi:putative N6-adenine-specific DNA methylase [Lachnospiraceae bacterium XBB1006]|nr:putative N6-adenine-specific DNA methylase [Lachnospiraceae bacterium XBB1006]